MADRSGIEWTEATWNPITGCTKVSQGCKNCYAERLTYRLQRMGSPRYRNGFEVTTHPELLDLPLEWAKSRTIFVNSMSDLFHEDVPLSFIQAVFATMKATPQHTYQVLTKRAGRLNQLSKFLPWPGNVWVGVSVESAKEIWRVHHLRGVPAGIRFLSVEPLLGPVPAIPLEGIHWVIVGGESGPHARPMDPAWVRDIRGQCMRSGVAFFFKQWGGTSRKAAGRVLDDRTWDEVPTRQNLDLRPAIG